MRITERTWDPEFYRDRALDTVLGLADSDAKAWLEHPCTAYMINELKADLSQRVRGWVSGTYTDRSFEGTAQENARRIGEAQYIEDILEMIELVGKNLIKGEDEYDVTTTGSYRTS